MDGPQGECAKHFTPVFLGRGIVGENVLLLVGYITLQLPLQYIMLVESM